ADVPARPRPRVLVLLLDQVGEHGFLVLRPRQPRALVLLREHLAVPVVAQDVDELGEVVALVLVVADAALGDGDVVLAELHPLLGEVALVLAGAEGAGDGGGGDRRALLAGDGLPGPGPAIDHAAL